MNWYHAANGQQLGPFDEQAFQELISKGEIQATTLVWHGGMTGWKPLSESGFKSGAVTVEPALFCSECGTRYPSDELLHFGSARVCANCKDRFTQKIREGVTPGEVRHYAGFWIRTLARILDGILIWIVFYAGAFGLSSLGASTTLGSGSTAVLSLLFLLQWATAALYEILLTAHYGATLGKRVLGLRVMTERGGQLTVSLSAGRYLAQLVSSATLTIGYIMAAFDPEKRALHDRICNTRVVTK